MRRFATVCVGIGLLAGCAPNEPGTTARPPAAAEGARGFQPGTSRADSSSDAEGHSRSARRLAGLEGGEPGWSRHAEEMEALWSDAEARHLQTMRAWSSSTLAPLVARADLPLFYPFGGPDFLAAYLLFPQAPTYVLVGLQPPGRLPVLDEMAPETLEAELERLRGGFQSLVEAGYFQQTDLDQDFTAERLDGMLPVLYVFLARTGHQVLSVRYLAIDDDGELYEQRPGEASTAVAVEFRHLAEETPRTLLYFAQDLSDQGLREHPEFVRYLESLGPWNVLMKAAVYLLHMDGFDMLRDLLLRRTGTLLQDDSGLPLRDLTASGWDLRFFGAYTRTLPVYGEWFQEDLRAAFEETSARRPLDFAIGYHSQIGEGCLILANRQAAP